MSIIFVILLSSIAGLVDAQSTNRDLVIGESIPPLSLIDVSSGKDIRISTRDFKGRWLLLDFWSMACSSCIEEFYKIDSIQNRFQNALDVVMIGDNRQRENKGIEKVYTRLKSTIPLKVIVAFDSTVFLQWRIVVVPTKVLVDPQGIIKYIITGSDLTTEKVGKILRGESVTFFQEDKPRTDFAEKGLDVSREDLLFSATLSKWSGEAQSGGYSIEDFLSAPEPTKLKGWIITKASLYQLYNFAYFGRWWWRATDTTYHARVHRTPILEVMDSTPFQFDFRADEWKGTYNYILKAPLKHMNEAYIRNELRKTLHEVFGYDVSMECREIPVWKLIRISEKSQKLKSQNESGEPYLSDDVQVPAVGFTVKNFPIDGFLYVVTYYLPNKELLQYVNESGLTGKVDVTIKNDILTYNAVRKALKENGLDLIRGTKEMHVLIIRDQ